MTAPARAPVAASLTREGRLQLLLDLHQQSGTITGEERDRRLRELAHPSLPWEQAKATFEGHQRCVEDANELRDGKKDWSQIYGEDTLASYPGDRDEAALWLREDEARALMWTLATGEM